jgi:hypothetical protein
MYRKTCESESGSSAFSAEQARASKYLFSDDEEDLVGLDEMLRDFDLDKLYEQLKFDIEAVEPNELIPRNLFLEDFSNPQPWDTV